MRRRGFLALPAMGLLSMPMSWLLLEHYKLWLMPLLQPLRVLLFVTLAMQFLTAAAGALASRAGRPGRRRGGGGASPTGTANV